MRIFGLDFTSSPGHSKPIALAACLLDGERLYVDALVSLESFEMFQNFMGGDGPWLAGMDFPFGQPRRLVHAMGWPEDWSDCVGHLEQMSMEEFDTTLTQYRDAQPEGDKQYLRATDRWADSRSPMMMYGVPVGRMFLRGSPMLYHCSASILPCRPRDDERRVVEAYPALVVRCLVGRDSYKAEGKTEGEAGRRDARRRIIDGLSGEIIQQTYGLKVVLHPAMASELVEDASGDCLDSVLCAVQAAWAWRQGEPGLGIPADADPLEGWIVDPLGLAPGDNP